ncbi:hypothetical protein CPC08DRAFT_633237, partial [Agrocybe pediades]
MVIKHVLGVGEQEDGLYGKTSAYYGTVEQQGRLTLHLHMMLWIEGALSPQEIRDRIMSGDSAFQKSLVDYLEGVHTGDFFNGTMDDVRKKQPSKRDPTQTMPSRPASKCAMSHAGEQPCNTCTKYNTWMKEYKETVDDLVIRSNVHVCRASRESKLNKKKQRDHSPIGKAARYGQKGCLNKEGICTARFPRDVRDETVVDEKDGHIHLKKLESMINTFTPALTYVTRCNTDVSSLLSGTSIKAIISYVTDYVTKPALKTYQVFSSAYDVYSK